MHEGGLYTVRLQDECHAGWGNPGMDDLKVIDPPHVLPLMDFVRSLRAQGLSVPGVDPKDGGIFARALLLLESPGPKAVGTQFISQDNPDWSASNMKRTLAEAGAARATISNQQSILIFAGATGA